MSRERREASPDEQSEESTEGRKIFVGGLSLEVTESDLYKAFEKYGVVRAQIQYDAYSKRSRGFGFVIFGDEKSCRKAVDEMEGEEIRAKRVTVKMAIPPDDMRSGFRGRGGGGRFFRGGGRGRFNRFDHRYDPRYDMRAPMKAYGYPDYERHRPYESRYDSYERYQPMPMSRAYEDPYAYEYEDYPSGGGGGGRGGGGGYFDRYEGGGGRDSYYPPKARDPRPGGGYPEGYRSGAGYEDRYTAPAGGGSGGPDRSYRDRGYSTRSGPYDRPVKR